MARMPKFELLKDVKWLLYKQNYADLVTANPSMVFTLWQVIFNSYVNTHNNFVRLLNILRSKYYHLDNLDYSDERKLRQWVFKKLSQKVRVGNWDLSLYSLLPEYVSNHQSFTLPQLEYLQHRNDAEFFKRAWSLWDLEVCWSLNWNMVW